MSIATEKISACDHTNTVGPLVARGQWALGVARVEVQSRDKAGCLQTSPSFPVFLLWSKLIGADLSVTTELACFPVKS